MWKDIEDLQINTTQGMPELYSDPYQKRVIVLYRHRNMLKKPTHIHFA